MLNYKFRKTALDCFTAPSIAKAAFNGKQLAQCVRPHQRKEIKASPKTCEIHTAADSVTRPANQNTKHPRLAVQDLACKTRTKN